MLAVLFAPLFSRLCPRIARCSFASSYCNFLLPNPHLLPCVPHGRWGYFLPLAQWHLNTTPTAALGGRSPYWARYGINPNVTALPPLEQLFELLGFTRWAGGAACLLRYSMAQHVLDPPACLPALSPVACMLAPSSALPVCLLPSIDTSARLPLSCQLPRGRQPA